MPLEAALKKLLVDCGAAEDLVSHVEKRKCVTVDMLSNWATTKEEIPKTMLAGSDFADDMPSIAIIRSAWEKAQTLRQRALRRSVEGLAEEPEDSVMDPQVHRELLDKFRKMYGIRHIMSANIVTDQLLTAWKREFEKARVTPFEFIRVKTQAAGIMQMPAQRKRIADKITIDFGEEDNLLMDSSKECVDILMWLDASEITCFSWAIAGCFEVQFAKVIGGPEEEVLFVHLQEVTDYRFEFKSRIPELRERYQDYSIARYVNRTEMEFRLKAIELTRGERRVPWGMALLMAIQANPSIWSKHESLLLEIERFKRHKTPSSSYQNQNFTQQPQVIPGLPAIMDSPAVKKGKDGGKGGGKNAQKMRMARTRDGPSAEKLCVRFNDKRGCSEKACKYQHLCDAVLQATGQACMSKSHNAMHHDFKKHGSVKMVN